VSRRWKFWLCISLALNALLVMGLYKKSADTRAYYSRQWGYWFPSAAPEPPTQRLAPAPAQPSDFAQQLVDTSPSAHAYRGESGKAFARWQTAGRAAFAGHLGFAPRPFAGRVVRAERTEFPTFVREKLYLQSADGLWIPAYMLTPKGAAKPRPAVLAMPGHDGPADASGRGAASIAGRDTNLNYMRSFGLRLAEAGYVVLAVDVAGVGEMAELNYLRLVRQGLLVGVPLKRLMLEEVHTAMDYLVSRPEVDAQRVGTMGMSLGGELAMFAGILDPRVKFVVSSGFFYSYKHYAFTSAASLFIPGILRVGDIPDLAAMVAPRPMLIQVGQYDPLIDAKRVGPYYTKVQQAYGAAGAPNAVSLDLFPHSHVMGVPTVLTWMKRHVPLDAKAL
jgi:dienelactone hydrolase